MDLILHGTPAQRQHCQESPHAKTPSQRNPAQKRTLGRGRSTNTPNHNTPDAPRQGPKPAALHSLCTNNSNKGSVITQSKLVKIQNVITPRPHSRMQYPRPQGVPSLNLGRLTDGDNSLQNPISDYQEKLDPPDTASTVSWGYNEYTPGPTARSPAMNAPFALHHTPSSGRPSSSNRTQRPESVPRLELGQKNKSAWSEPAVPDNIPPPSVRQIHDKTDQRGGQQKKKLKPPYRTDNDSVDDGVNPQSSTRQDKKVDADVLAGERRRRAIEQTVLVDQLSRSVICDPEQNDRCETPVTGTTPSFGQPRPKIRTLHQSKIRTTGTVSENLLDKRLTFNARVVTRSGHDALRELCGFYFDLDQTMTLYEYRQFGSKSKALPFIQRGKYCHVGGRRKGRQYVVQDITAGTTLTFNPEGQPALSPNLRSQSVLLVRITHVDETAKEKLVFASGRVPYDAEEYHAKMNPPLTKQELADRKLMEQVQDAVRSQLRKRGCKTLTGLGRHFKQLDKLGDGVLSKDELRHALDTYHIKVDQKSFESLWMVLDQNEDGAVDFGEFRRSFIGEMKERRKTFVRKAFQKIDANKSGTVSIDELKKFFNVHKHPHVVQGLATASEIMDDFLHLFDQRTKEISYGEFEDYYEGVSVSMNNDDDFNNMMSACWMV